jgi:hypothetical protein
MIDPDGFAAQFIAVEIVDRQDRAPLVFVAQKSEPLAFARLLVTRQDDVHDVPVLGKYDRNVPFVHEVVQTADVDVGTGKVFVPGTFVCHTEFQFPGYYVVYYFCGVHLLFYYFKKNK